METDIINETELIPPPETNPPPPPTPPSTPTTETLPLHAPPKAALTDEALISLEQETQNKLKDFNASKVWGIVREQDAIVPALDEILFSKNFSIDPNWKGPTEEQIAEADVPTEFHPELYKSLNGEHYEHLKSKLQKELANEEAIANYGAKGAWLRFAAGIFDEGNLAIAATLPLFETGVPEALVAHKVGRLGSALRTALGVGVENAGVQALVNESNLSSNPEDIAYAALFGLGFGGALGGAFHRSTSEQIKNQATKTIQDVTYKDVVDSKGNAGAAEVTGPQANQSLADNPLSAEEITTPTTAFGDIRLDVAAQLSKSGLHSARKLGDDFVEDAVGKKGHDINSAGGSASTIQRQTQKKWITNYRKASEPIYQAWVKETLGYKERFLHPIKHREDFYKAVTRHVELEDSTNPHVIKAADTQRDTYESVLREMQEASVHGAKDIPIDRRYTCSGQVLMK